MAQHIMIDLETLSLASDAGIIQIGAQAFNPDATSDDEVLIGEGICVNIDPQAVMNAGMRIEWSTLHWWMSQPDAFNTLAAPGEGYKLSEGLVKLTAYVNVNGGSWAKVWANGAAFDIPVLETSYRRCTLNVPWGYSNVLDMRTMKFLAPGVGRVEPKIAHNALSDARAQALFVSRCYQEIKQPKVVSAEFVPTHCHVKRGYDYQVLGEAEGQVSSTPDKMAHLEEGDRLTIYRNVQGKLYWRLPAEFNDGRFSSILEAKKAPAGEEDRQEPVAAAEETIAEAPVVAKSELLLFYERLEGHDWWYMMSEDPSVNRAGEREESGLRAKIEQGGEQYRELYNQYYSHKWSGSPKPDRPEA